MVCAVSNSNGSAIKHTTLLINNMEMGFPDDLGEFVHSHVFVQSWSMVMNTKLILLVKVAQIPWCLYNVYFHPPPAGYDSELGTSYCHLLSKTTKAEGYWWYTGALTAIIRQYKQLRMSIRENKKGLCWQPFVSEAPLAWKDRDILLSLPLTGEPV